MKEAIAAIVSRDLKLALRAGGGAGIGVMFFLAVVAITPFAIGPDMKLLARVGAAELWIGALLASLLGLDRVFAVDQEDGSLDLLLMAPLPLTLVAAAKGAAHWCATGLPLVIAAPLLGLLLGLEPAALGAVTLTLLIGTPALTFLGLVGASLVGDAAARGHADGGSGIAACRTGPDLRGRGDRGGGERRAVQRAAPAAACAFPLLPGAWAGGRRGGAAACARLKRGDTETRRRPCR